MFELRTEPAPAGLAPLGSIVEIRELSYGAMRATMQAAEAPGQSAERLLGDSLFVDGAALGYEGLRALPGRFSSAIADALSQTMRMHGLERAATPSAEAAEGAGTTAPADASNGPKA